MDNEQSISYDIIPKVDESQVVEWNNLLNNTTSEQYKKFKKIADGAKKAKNSMEEYIATCIKMDKQASESDYANFIAERMSEKAYDKQGIKDILRQYDELETAVESARNKFENEGGTEALAALEAQIASLRETVQTEPDNPEGVAEAIVGTTQEAVQNVVEGIQEEISNLNDSDNSGDENGDIIGDAVDTGLEAASGVNIEDLETRAENLRNLQDELNATEQEQRSFNASVTASNSDLANYANSVQDGTRSTAGYTTSLIKAKLSAFGAAAGTAAFNAALSMGLSVAIQAAVTGIVALVNHYKDLREANLEVANEFEETSESIQTQIDKIRELQKVVEDETSTSNELYDARSDLLDIQRELINTYGTQAENIDLVNGKLDEEIDKLDEVERLQAAQAFHKMSQESYEKDKKVLEETNTQVHRKGAKSFTPTRTLSDGFVASDEWLRQAQKLEEKALSLGYSKIEDKSNGDYYTLVGKTTEESIEITNQLMSYIEENIPTTSDLFKVRDRLSENLQVLDSEDYQKKKSNVEAYALQSILSNETYRPLYKGLEAAAADYDEAIKSGDKVLAQSSINRINELQGKIANLNIDDEYIKKQFSSTLDQIQDDLNKNKLKVEVETLIKSPVAPLFMFGDFRKNVIGNSTPAEYFKNAFEGYSDIDVENIGVSGGSEKEVKAYNMLEKAANYYEMEVEDVIDVLVELGIIFSRDADAAKYTTTNFSSMLEEVEKTTEGLDKFVSAQQKVATGSALTADEVNELIKLDGSLASSVERTANGYVISSEKLAEARAKYINEQKESLKEDIAASEKQLENVKRELAVNQKIVDELGSKSDLTDDEKRKLNDAKAIVENRLEDKKATTEQLEQQKLLLGQIISPLEDYAAMFKDVADKAESVTDKLAQMRSGQYKTGVIDPTDVLDFINEVPDWQNYIEINNGKATLKDTSGEALKEQIKQTSGYYDVSEKLNDKLKERNELQNKINDFEANNVIDSPSEVKMLDDMNGELDILNGTIDISEKQFKALTAILDVFFGKIEKKQAITDFEDEISKLNHKKSLGMSEDAWAGEYATIANNYRNDLKALADDGDTDALSKLWEIDEQLYQNNIDATQRAFDDKKLIIDNAREDLQKSVLEYRNAYAALNEEYYAPGTALGNTEDGKKQYAANLREIEKLSSEAYDNITSRFQSAIDFGKIIDPNIINDLADVFKGQELPDAVAQVIQKGIETGIWNATDLATIAPYLTEALLAGSDVNSEAYQNAINQQKDYVISAFEYEKTQLDNQLEAGLISSGDFIDEYTKLWEKYYKDKKEFAEEDLQTQKDILEAHKSEIQKQIDALEAYSENQTEPYQNEIDALNDVKDAYDDMMDTRLDALEEEKKAIEKKNEQQEEANDLQEKWKNLQKASMNKRLVYTGSGGWELRRDEEEYKSAKKEYDEAKKEDATSKLDKAIDKLQEEKEARDKAIDKDIKSREDAIAKIEKPIDNLTKVLTALVAEQHNIDPQFIAQLLDSESGETAITALNKAMGFGQQQELKYGTDANNDLLTNETAQNIAKDVEKRNKTNNEAAKSIGLDLGGNSSANKTEQKAKNPIISDLINQWNTFQSELAKMPANFGEDGHKGKVDYNHRTAVLHDTEGNYGTLYGTTLTYADMAKIFEQYLVEQEKQGKIINESIWDISKALWKKAEELPDGAFNMTPFKPNGETVVDLNSDNFDDEMYDYVISQLAQGIRLEDMDTFMGGDYATIDEADKAAQQMHEDNASLYDQGKDILLQLVLLGYDINKLQGAAYDGTPVDAETANKNLTDALKENTTATKGNSSATENNSTATTTNTEATKSSSDATTANTTAVTDGAVEVGKYALKSNEDDGTITKEPILDSKGNFVSNKSVKALSHSDWAKKHKVSEWAPDGKHVNENMTMEQYETLKKGQKNGIIPASIVDIADITDAQLKQFLEAIQSNTKITPQNVSPTTTTTTATAAEAINQNVTNAPIINQTITIEGSADKKTIAEFKTVMDDKLVECMNYLGTSMNNAFMRQINKS